MDDDDAGEDAPGVIVDWLLVELGTLEALPVTSGESPALCANDAFQESDPVGSRYAQCGTRVTAGMASGKVPGDATEVQLCDHRE